MNKYWDKNFFIYCCWFLLDGSELIAAKCPPNIFSKEGDLYVISSAQNAMYDSLSYCSSVGGSIVEIGSSIDKNKLYPHLQEMFIPESDFVFITLNTHNADPPRARYSTRIENFQSSNTGNVSNLKPPKGELNEIVLYKRQMMNYRKNLSFCINDKSHKIKTECSDKWKLNFEVYGNNDSDNAFKLYYYDDPKDESSSFISLQPKTKSNLKLSKISVNLPDVSVFVGATHKIVDEIWKWTNGSKAKFLDDDNNITEPMIISDEADCQQMTWPLTYNDGINFHPKPCDTGLSHSLCKKKFIVNAVVDKCQTNQVKIKWENIFKGVYNITPKAYVYVKLLDTNSHYSAKFDRYELNIDRLEREKKYYFWVKMNLPDCPNFELFSLVEVIIPGRIAFPPVESLKVDDLYSRAQGICRLKWIHKVDRHASYTIRIISDKKETAIFKIPGYDVNITNLVERTYDFDVSNFSLNRQLIIEVATKGCSLTSDYVLAQGYCMNRYNFFLLVVTVAVLTTISGAILITSVVGILIKSRVDKAHQLLEEQSANPFFGFHFPHFQPLTNLFNSGPGQYIYGDAIYQPAGGDAIYRQIGGDAIYR